MKFAVVLEYDQKKDIGAAVAENHHDYLRGFLTDGKLFAAGPFANNLGAVWIMEAASMEMIEAVVKADPFSEAGLFLKWQIHPLNHWSARQHKGQ